MKTKITLFTVILALFGLSDNANAQAPISEKSYETPKKHKDRTCETVEVEINKEKETIDVAYISPSFFSSSGEFSKLTPKIKHEIYTYDKNLELINTGGNPDRPNNDYGEKVYHCVAAQGTTFSKIKVTCKWESDRRLISGGEYRTNHEVIKTAKPTLEYFMLTESSDGDKDKIFKLTTSRLADIRNMYDSEADKSVLCLVGRQIPKTINSFMKYYHILHCDIDLNITVADSINFEYFNQVLYSGPLKDDKKELNADGPNHDWIVVFAPTIGGKNSGDPKRSNFTYVRISPKGKVLEKFSFESPSNCWHIEGACEKDGSVYLYGMSIIKEPAKNYHWDVKGSKEWDKLTYTNFQIGKITNGKFDFISSPSLKDIEAKQAKPANQKNFLKLDGEDAETTGISFSNSGDILINYQDYETRSDPDSHDKVKTYTGIFLFQFDATGNIKKTFEVQLPDPEKVTQWSANSWENPSKNYFYTSGDGKSLYWFIRSVKDARGRINSDLGPMYGIDYGSINIETGDISEFKTIGVDKKNPSYLFKNTAGYQVGNYIYFFSEPEKRDKMLLTRIDISK